MSLIAASGDAVGLTPASADVSSPTPPSDELERRLKAFFEIAAAVGLTSAEQRILLDVTAQELALLRVAPAGGLPVCGVKLERRVTYAIPLLQRMAASGAS